MLSTEASMFVCGVLRPVPEGQSAPGNQELAVDYYEVVGHSPPGGADSLLNEVLFDFYFFFNYSSIINRNRIPMFNWTIDI